MPLIKKVALTERNTEINAIPPTPGAARGYGQHLALQAAPIIFYDFLDNKTQK